jgi:hypothetical protein
MADLKDILRHLITHAEGYATPAARQEHLDVLEHLDGPPPPVTETGAGEGN